MAQDTTIKEQDTTGRLLNLEELIENKGGKMVDIVIPKIQRAYAQGRKREANTREPFIHRIFDFLSKGEAMELNFVYGSKNNNESGTIFELLDGQQRLTTLFLLYWYLSMAENRDISSILKHFTYETRTTSTDFIQKLVESRIDVSQTMPSLSICSRQWYTIAYDKDSTVQGMLTMLDTIHRIYQERGCPKGMFDNLSKLRFYELDLQDFGLTEEIYIKMNARGLQLTPFENFKADLVKYMKDDKNSNYKEEVEMDIVGHPKVPYYLNFSQKLDSKWLNLFWNKDDQDNNAYCDKFFRFFYRYFAHKYYVDVRSDYAAQEFRPKRDADWDFLWTMSPNQSSDIDNTYFGFSVYKKILDEHPQYIHKIEKVLDALCKEDVAKLLSEKLVAPWDNKNRMNFFEEDYRLQDAVMFGAVIEYIEASYVNVNVDNLRKWIRVVWNSTENQLFQNVNEVVSTVRYLTEIVSAEGATNDIYSVLGTMTEKNYTRALREETRKAAIISHHPNEDWEAAFIEAERHPFFRGAIGYFLFDPIPSSVEQFRHRTEIMSQMFNGNGIAEPFMDGHILIMSLMRQLNTREKMGMRKDWKVSISITERYDTQNHLKSLLQDRPAIREYLCRLSDMPTIEAVQTLMKAEFKQPIEFVCDCDDKKMNGKSSRAFKRLATDVRLYDFISDEQDSTHILEFTYLDNLHYAINKKRAWYSKFFIESERNLIIPKLVEEEKLEYDDPNEIGSYNKYYDFFGYNVDLKKTLLNGQLLMVRFVRGTDVFFLLHNPSPVLLSQFSTDELQDYHDGWFKVASVSYLTKDNYDTIVNKLHEVENKCQSV